jgi:hypothetical protein
MNTVNLTINESEENNSSENDESQSSPSRDDCGEENMNRNKKMLSKFQILENTNNNQDNQNNNNSLHDSLSSLRFDPNLSRLNQSQTVTRANRARSAYVHLDSDMLSLSGVSFVSDNQIIVTLPDFDNPSSPPSISVANGPSNFTMLQSQQQMNNIINTRNIFQNMNSRPNSPILQPNAILTIPDNLARNYVLSDDGSIKPIPQNSTNSTNSNSNNQIFFSRIKRASVLSSDGSIPAPPPSLADTLAPGFGITFGRDFDLNEPYLPAPPPSLVRSTFSGTLSHSNPNRQIQLIQAAAAAGQGQIFGSAVLIFPEELKQFELENEQGVQFHTYQRNDLPVYVLNNVQFNLHTLGTKGVVGGSGLDFEQNDAESSYNLRPATPANSLRSDIGMMLLPNPNSSNRTPQQTSREPPRLLQMTSLPGQIEGKINLNGIGANGGNVDNDVIGVDCEDSLRQTIDVLQLTNQQGNYRKNKVVGFLAESQPDGAGQDGEGTGSDGSFDEINFDDYYEYNENNGTGGVGVGVGVGARGNHYQDRFRQSNVLSKNLPNWDQNPAVQHFSKSKQNNRKNIIPHSAKNNPNNHPPLAETRQIRSNQPYTLDNTSQLSPQYQQQLRNNGFLNETDEFLFMVVVILFHHIQCLAHHFLNRMLPLQVS